MPIPRGSNPNTSDLDLEDTGFEVVAHLPQVCEVFLAALADPQHNPFFSIEDAPAWITSHPDNATAMQLKAYLKYRVDTWVSWTTHLITFLTPMSSLCSPRVTHAPTLPLPQRPRSSPFLLPRHDKLDAPSAGTSRSEEDLIASLQDDSMLDVSSAEMGVQDFVPDYSSSTGALELLRQQILIACGWVMYGGDTGA
ncbi:hypothetical protein DFH08DRAFT_814619 [Mycena albidolilacea]|uniref:Uncharacterized protein n=1 Tax=Mycena albidolilacea TaxID=1033008 RepID=A0AAD7EL18_9AGAR|nr:hypothetical protein DFH08DRAFT_814619 [Mycena albidolilacea]